MKYKNRFLTGVVGFLLCMGGVQAQTTTEQSDVKKKETSQADDKSETEENVVTITGYRSSLIQAIAMKREETGFTDSIVATDISDLADQNLAEAIQRVPGVSIVRVHGKAEKVGIRNLPPSFTKTIINNLATTSGTGREVDFSIFASEIVQEVTVRKSPRASDEEGGIAGTINITTARPFDFDGFTFAGSGEFIYNDYSEENDPRVSVLVSNTINDKFGILASFQHEVRSFRYDNVYGQGAERRTLGSRFKGPVPTELEGINFIENVGQRLNFGEEERTGGTLALDWHSSDTLKFGFDVMVSKYDRLKEQYTHQAKIREGDGISNYTFDADTNLLTSATFSNVPSDVSGKVHPQEEDYKQYALSMDWTPGDWEVEGLAGVSDSTFSRQELSWSHLAPDTQSVSYRYVGDLILSEHSGTDDAYYNPDLYAFKDGKDRRDFSTDKKTVFQLDARRLLDHEWIDSIQFGARYAEKSYTDDRIESSKIKETLTGISGNTMTQDGAQSIGGNSFGSGFSGGGSLGGFYYVPYNLMLENYFNGIEIDPTSRPQDYFEVDEDVFSLYIEGDLSFTLGQLPTSINAGVRYVKSDITGTGNLLGGAEIVASTNDASYSNVLPSLNLSIELNDDLLGRFSVARVMTRPRLSDLSGRWDVNNSNQTIKAGNPGLMPLEADQFDIGLEYYFNDESLLGAAFFYKDLKTFFTDTEASAVMFDNGNGLEEFSLVQTVNGTGASIKGFELIYQQPFTFLPTPWDGLGINLNYSYVESTAGTETASGKKVELKDLSKNTYNAVLYYEKDKFDIRLSYNHRSSSLLNANGIGKYNGAYGQLDFATGYQLTDAVKLTLKVINLGNDTYFSSVGGVNNYLNEGSAYGRRISLGARARF